MKPRILVVDDNKDLARGAALVLSEVSDDVLLAHSAEEALEKIQAAPPDIVFSDIRMPGMSGVQLLHQVRERWPDIRVVLLTAYGTVESAVEAMKAGAFDYVTKPFNDDELVLVARHIIKELEAEEEIHRLRAEVREKHCFRGICSRDRRMWPVMETIRKVAPTNATVLVCGESGTGKELVARAIHNESPRREQPFVAFNAAAVTETLAEAMLFGAKKGSYTGADRDRKGLFLEAHGGTLFIDEVSSMPPTLQGKLLRALQEREVMPVGATTSVRVDVRVVAATNVEPQRLLTSGVMRKDLYYRLSVVRITLPPLRERVEDIPLLANLFLERLAESSGLPPRRLSPRAMRLLLTHDWPGNVRELQNVMERAAVMAPEEEIGPQDIRLEDDDLGWSPDAEEGLTYEEARREVLERFQRRFVERLMADTGGNLSAAARRAGITRAALYRMVKRLGLEIRDEAELSH
ncbi:MAG: sigma-54 dependent transcriptional regulator [Myxococcota bacterium]